MSEARNRFLEACFWYGPLDEANRVVAVHPEIVDADIHVAAALGHADAVARFIAANPASVHDRSGPQGSDPLTMLCFSRYLAHDASRSDDFIRAATALLDAGADPNTGFYNSDHSPRPTRESALYGAAGVAFHPGITRLLLDRGADPNDDEVPYHSVEGPNNDAYRVLLASGKLSRDSLSLMLLRKSDWHDYEGIELTLDHGADVNAISRFGRTGLHHAILSDNRIEIIELLVSRGGDPTIVARNLDHGGPVHPGRSAISLAARRGRGDVLDLFERRGIMKPLSGAEAIIAECAYGRTPRPEHLDELRADAGQLLCEFAGTDNAAGIAALLDLGLAIDAKYGKRDGYFDLTPESTALHSAAWRLSHDALELLVARGADVNVRDGKGRTPLMLAVAGATQSYWQRRRSPRSVKALLDAGATKSGVSVPTGYAAIDQLLS